MKVRDYMTEAPVFANLNDGLHQTYRRMRERDIRHMLVVDDNELLVGIVSERDLLRPSYVDDGPNQSGSYVLDNTGKVAAAMAPSPATVTPDQDILDAVSVMLERKYGAMPVVDGEGRAIGVLSVIDVLRAFWDHSRS